ncbi:class I SAM-dependent methyltransferase [Roseimicrobium sp. ORNL1]|uniref:class I SAM-dependent methyltransferase n=1 Tax=Roseimicrobium sp. ORNL1 TaxID=2711231 RepID=UPI0013E0FD55|nr:class I SAM-dependent methyltransferase [Roseimicrobium sp. ORNL1]QIF03333.1 class I SAM-dependent methyltransferase [Roseimicrobium sp. ORNL1]
MGYLRYRVLKQEMLDTLPHDDPDALASRQDIEVINHIMGTLRWFQRQLRDYVPSHGHIVELGAGDGTLIHHIAQTSPELVARWTGLDLAPRPSHLPLGVQWVQGDFLQSEASQKALAEAEVVVANLILHHFTEEQLRRLAPRLQQARVILVSEPARHLRHYVESRVLNLIGEFNHVTSYDMKCSIEAGFRVGELPRALMLDREQWDIEESHSLFGACRMVAINSRR